MKIGPLAVLLVLMVAGGAAAAPAAAPTDNAALQKELDGYYAKVADAIRNKTAEPALGFISPDLKERDVFGKIHTRAEIADRLKKNLAMTESISDLSNTIIALVANDKFAVALVKRHAAANIKDPQGKPHALDSEARALDVWVKTDDGWKLRYIDGLSVNQKLDGKAMVPPRPRRASTPGAVLAWADDPGRRRLAQWYVTPYNYGWPGVGYTYGYGYPGTMAPPGIPTTRANLSNYTASVNAQNAQKQRDIYQQQRAYEQAAKAQKAQQQQMAKLQQQMQAYMEAQQKALQAQPSS